jgi:hypothetical protein
MSEGCKNTQFRLLTTYDGEKNELRCNAVELGESPTFQKSISPKSSGSKSKPSKKSEGADGQLSKPPFMAVFIYSVG